MAAILLTTDWYTFWDDELSEIRAWVYNYIIWNSTKISHRSIILRYENIEVQ